MLQYSTLKQAYITNYKGNFPDLATEFCNIAKA